MRTLVVYIEMNGQQNYVGQIKGNGLADACFTYADEYCAKSEAVSISLSLPISEKIFLRYRHRIFLKDFFRKDSPGDALQIGCMQMRMII